VNLRTFLPPASRPTPEPPAPGEPARRLPPPGAGGDGPVVVMFLRHTGCPFAEATMRAAAESAAESSDIGWIAVSHAPARATQRWCEAVGGCGGVQVLLDPERVFYASWGLGRSSLGHFMGRRSLAQVTQLARRGIRNRHPDGTRWQQAGTFAVDGSGTVRWRHLPEHAGDLPDLSAAGAAVAPARAAVT
jgi:AhpC/TSA antioxidant enzyme